MKKTKIKNRLVNFSLYFLFLVCFSLISSPAQQSGGQFVIMQSLHAAGGGGKSAGGSFAIEGTAGQTAAGTNATSGNFKIVSGFWNERNLLPPTAARVSVGGRVLTTGGNGVRSVRVTLTTANGETRTAFSTSFGYYRFEDVSVGETYIVSVAAKRFTFSQPTVIRSVFEEIGDLDFIADTP